MSNFEDRLKKLEEALGVIKKRKQVIVVARSEGEIEAKKEEVRQMPENKDKELDFLVIVYAQEAIPNNPPEQNKDLPSTN